MSDPTLRERVARALCRFADVDELHWEEFAQEADAALAAIEEAQKSILIKIAAECHRAKWQFDDDKDPTGIVAFRELHRIGDMAKEAALGPPK